MELALNIDLMTVKDKLAAMERFWEDRGLTPEAVPSPSWHGEVAGEGNTHKRGQVRIRSAG